MSTLSESEENKLHELFNEFDKDSNNKLDVGELLLLAQRFGLNPKQDDVEACKAKYDVNEDGGLDFEEMKELIVDIYVPPEKRRVEIEDCMKTIYLCEGLSDDAPLTKDQFLKIFQEFGSDPLTSEDVDEIFMDLDKDGDTETITKQEIAILFNSTD